MKKGITITFKTPEEQRVLLLIKAITFSSSPKAGILAMASTYDALCKECSTLKAGARDRGEITPKK